jgi:hypothetical protein
VVTGVVLVGTAALALAWPRLRWLPGALLAGAAAAAWLGTEVVALVVSGTWPVFPSVAAVAVYGGVLLLLQLGLRLSRGRGLPVALGVGLWLAVAVLTWAIAFATAYLGPEVPTAAAGGAVLGAFVLLAVAVAAVRHSGLAVAGTAGRVHIGKPLTAPRRTG